MKNITIKSTDVVPVNIRKEVYKDAIKIIEGGEPLYQLSSFSLCLLLPCILWDLGSYLDDEPSIDLVEDGWDSTTTPNMFPELTDDKLASISSISGGNVNQIRLQVLNEMLSELN